MAVHAFMRPLRATSDHVWEAPCGALSGDKPTYALIQKRRRICTTDSHHSDPVAPNLVQRDAHRPCTQSEMAHCYHRRLDCGGLVVSSCGFGCLFTTCRWLGYGLAPRRKPGGRSASSWHAGWRNPVEELMHHGDSREKVTPASPIKQCWLSFTSR